MIAFGFAAYYAATKASGPSAPVLAAFLKQDHPCKTIVEVVSMLMFALSQITKN